MDGILPPALYLLAGACLYAAFHHAAKVRGRPLNWTHLWFFLLCLMVAGHVVAKAGGYQAQSAEEIVFWRRWDTAFAAMVFIFLVWFVREYAGLRSVWGPALLSLLLFAFVPLAMLLPHGVVFTELPAMIDHTLPWGEQVTDIRVRPFTNAHGAGWFAVLMSLAYGLYGGVQQYRRGEYTRARWLLVALAVFLLLLTINFVEDLGLLDFFYVGEFGFLALVFLMNRALELESRMARQHMEAVIHHVPALVYLKDLKGRFLLVNRGFEDLVGVPRPALIGRTDDKLFPPVDAERLRVNDRRVLESGHAVEFDEMVNIGGEALSFVTLKFPILDVDGRPLGVCGISTNVSAERELKDQIGTLKSQVWHADRVARVQTLGSSVAHELRQPLAAILANAEAGLHLLSREGADPTEMRDILQDVVRDNRRAIRIIEGLREMLRQGRSTRVRVLLGDLVSEVLDYLQGEVRRRGVVCERSLDPSCFVVVDKVQIGQVIMNLAMNALDAMEDRPIDQRQLSISVQPDEAGQACLTVRDSGSGLPPDASERIFEGLFSTKARGLGMGLALSRSIIEAHGGRIWATNNPEGGATVQLVLPLADDAVR